MAIGDWLSSFVPTANTALYLQLNNNANDSSANANNGTATNITYVAGRFGQAGSFNGSSSYITVTDTFPVRLWANYTVSCWLNFTALPTVGNLYNLWYKFTPTSALNWYECILYNNGGTQQILVTHAAHPSAWVTQSLNYALPTGRLFHFVASYWSGTMTFYVDWISIGSFSITAPAGDTWPLEFGRNTNINARFLSGVMDEVIVENITWSASQIQKYYMNSIGKYNLIIS
jgi:hypothetical protein